ncbi:hypothetical protein FS749_009248 [Ceratobasidium sp. UAMH 11750]|nr:hypothetical protein FS749_009248 [Ceratobasidium sp. UAMH 11750]
MPPQRQGHLFPRTTPLPQGQYAVPSALPPTFGVHELFDWSPKKCLSAASARSVSAGFSTFQRHWQKAKSSPSVAAWVKEQEDLLPLAKETKYVGQYLTDKRVVFDL